MSEIDQAEFVLTHAHSEPLAGEAAAAEKAARGAESMKAHILACIKAAKDYGMTPDEYSAKTGSLINTVRRRITDLWKEGHVRHHPESVHRDNADGNACVVWVAGYDPDGAIHQQQPRVNNRRLQELEAENARLAAVCQLAYEQLGWIKDYTKASDSMRVALIELGKAADSTALHELLAPTIEAMRVAELWCDSMWSKLPHVERTQINMGPVESLRKQLARLRGVVERKG